MVSSIRHINLFGGELMLLMVHIDFDLGHNRACCLHIVVTTDIIVKHKLVQ